ncbi:hypothetical protein PAPHI01_0095 [Pancytospora philotis]|nr:hypothetical protein PAPHI01_0095 [Pancytospora philotis]
MENSFSLDFNPLTNVKAVKDYEEEINRLKREVFELKTHLAHASAHPAAENMPKLLYEQNERLAQVLREKEEAARAAAEMKEMLAQANQAVLSLENKYSQDMHAGGEKIALLEDENKRLIMRMEKINRLAQEADAERAARAEAERLAANYKNFIQNLESQLEQNKYDLNTKIQEYEARIEEMQLQGRAEDGNRQFELESLRKRLDAERDRGRDNELVIADLRETVAREISRREQLSAERNAALQSGELAQRYEAWVAKARKDAESFAAGLGKFRTIIARKLQSALESVDALAADVQALQRGAAVSDENRRFLDKMRIRDASVGGIIDGLRRIVVDLLRKSELHKKEAADATFFAENNQRTFETKTVSLLEQFHKQFNEAKQELLTCQKYLIRKSEETKALKNENARLLRQVQTRPATVAAYPSLQPSVV